MKRAKGFAPFRTIASVVVAVAIGFVVTRMATQASKSPSAPSEAGLDNAIKQTRRLVAELRAVEWKSWKVDPQLLRLPEQDRVQSHANRAPDRNSFSIPRGVPLYDEVAVYCDTFVTRQPASNAPGRSRDVRPRGYFIVGWMDGRVTQVDVADLRYLPNPENEHEMFYVFPGMDEYDSALTALPGVPDTTRT